MGDGRRGEIDDEDGREALCLRLFVCSSRSVSVCQSQQMHLASRDNQHEPVLDPGLSVKSFYIAAYSQRCSCIQVLV